MSEPFRSIRSSATSSRQRMTTDPPSCNCRNRRHCRITWPATSSWTQPATPPASLPTGRCSETLYSNDLILYIERCILEIKDVPFDSVLLISLQILHLSSFVCQSTKRSTRDNSHCARHCDPRPLPAETIQVNSWLVLLLRRQRISINGPDRTVT